MDEKSNVAPEPLESADDAPNPQLENLNEAGPTEEASEKGLAAQSDNLNVAGPSKIPSEKGLTPQLDNFNVAGPSKIPSEKDRNLLSMYLEKAGPPAKDGHKITLPRESINALRELHKHTTTILGRHAIYEPKHLMPPTLCPSTTKLCELTPTCLSDLHLKQTAKRKYLALRTVESAKKTKCITTVVEDVNGDAVFFGGFNLTDELDPNLEDFLPIGTVFFLKEPCITLSKDKIYYLRCDCPGDVIFKESGNPLLPRSRKINGKFQLKIDPADNAMLRTPLPTSAIAWQALGKELAKTGMLFQARRAYCQAYSSAKDKKKGPDEPLRQKLLLELQKLYFKMGEYELAVQVTTEKMPDNPSANLIAGKSYCKLGYYEWALKAFQKCKNTQANEELKHIEEHMKEHGKDNFNIYSYYLTQRSETTIPTDCLDYTRSLQVVAFSTIGGIVFAADKIDPGTLIMVSKALAFSWKSAEAKPSANIMYEPGSSEHVIAKLAQHRLKNPCLAFETLSTVSGAIPCSDEWAVVKQRNEKTFCYKDRKLEPIVDIEYIRAIVEKFIFGGKRRDGSSSDFEYPLKDGSGLFGDASYFRHSCMPNAVAYNFGNVLFVRATKTIPSGMEVCLSFIPWELPHAMRKRFCASREFECDCELCTAESRNVERLRDFRTTVIRTRLMDDRRKIIDELRGGKCPIEKAEKLVDDMRRTFKHVTIKEFPETILMSAVNATLSQVYNSVKGTSSWNAKKHIDALHETLFYRGFRVESLLPPRGNIHNMIPDKSCLDETVLTSVADLVKIYAVLNNKAKQNEWRAVLLKLEVIFTGGNSKMVEEKYGIPKD